MKEQINKIIFFILIICSFNKTTAALSVSSSKVNLETLSTSLGEERVQTVQGRAKIIIKRENPNESAYPGVRISENNKKQQTKNILQNIQNYQFPFESQNKSRNVDIKISGLQIDNKARLDGYYNNIIFNSDQNETELTFDYEAKVTSYPGDTGSVGIEFVVDDKFNMNTNDIKSSTFLEINLEDSGSLMGVTVGTMSFGNSVEIGKVNLAVAPLVLEVRTGKTPPQNTFVQVEENIVLRKDGEIIPVKVTLEGAVDEIQNGKYEVLGITNGAPRSNLYVKGEALVPMGQKSGEYKGNINIRVTYTK